jgi:hypothetical protein
MYTKPINNVPSSTLPSCGYWLFVTYQMSSWVAGKDFLPFCRLSPKSSDYFLCFAFKFDAKSFSILSPNYWVFEVLFRNSLPMPICSSVFPIISGFILVSLIYFDLILVQGERRHAFSFILLYVDIQFSQKRLLKRQSFFYHVFWIPLSKISWLLLGPLFCCIGLHVCFYATTMLYSLLWPCSIVLSKLFWYL